MTPHHTLSNQGTAKPQKPFSPEKGFLKPALSSAARPSWLSHPTLDPWLCVPRFLAVCLSRNTVFDFWQLCLSFLYTTLRCWYQWTKGTMTIALPPLGSCSMITFALDKRHAPKGSNSKSVWVIFIGLKGHTGITAKRRAKHPRACPSPMFWTSAHSSVSQGRLKYSCGLRLYKSPNCSFRSQSDELFR